MACGELGVPVLHNYYASCTPYTQSSNVFRLRLSRGWTILAGIWHGCLNPAWVAGGLDLRTTFARVPAAPNDVIACGVHTSVNPAGPSRIWRHPPEISSSSVCVCVWANSVATDRHPSPPPARQQRTPRLAKQTRIDDRSGSGKWGTGVTTPGSHEVPWLHFVGWFSRASECDPRVAGSPVALRFCGEIRISSQKRGALEYHSVSHALGAPRQGRSRVLRSGL